MGGRRAYVVRPASTTRRLFVALGGVHVTLFNRIVLNRLGQTILVQPFEICLGHTPAMPLPLPAPAA